MPPEAELVAARRELANVAYRDAVDDDAIAAAGKQAMRSDGELPPHVMVYLVMALALFADDDCVKAGLTLPALELLPDGTYRSVPVNSRTGGKARRQFIEAAGWWNTPCPIATATVRAR